MNQKYVMSTSAGVDDLDRGPPLRPRDLGAPRRISVPVDPEAVLVRDADQLEMLIQLKEHLDVGNRNAEEWIPYSVRPHQDGVARDVSARGSWRATPPPGGSRRTPTGG